MNIGQKGGHYRLVLPPAGDQMNTGQKGGLYRLVLPPTGGWWLQCPGRLDSCLGLIHCCGTTPQLLFQPPVNIKLLNISQDSSFPNK